LPAVFSALSILSFGGRLAVGEKGSEPFQLSFNSSLNVDFGGSRVISDGELMVAQKLNERLGIAD
jgi:hypothetical protein